MVLSLTAATMQRAVTKRNRDYDGRFVYGVITTGCFCLPSCPSRQARPENRRFFANNAEAMAAGFRACKRCRPLALEPVHPAIIATVDYITRHCSEPLPLATLAQEVNLSPAYLQRLFKSRMGITPHQYHSAVRRKLFKQALRTQTVTSATHTAGFSSSSRVYDSLNRIGMTPRCYQQDGQGETIYYVCDNTSLGLLMLAATAQGVCFAQFGETEASLLQQLQEEFNQAQLVPYRHNNGPELKAWFSALNHHLASTAPCPNLPLDLRGTVFQIQVWEQLKTVEAGITLSYSELARQIGKPKAVRATASACGANKIALLIPCHRILRSDGGLGGYRWGTDRKRQLLEREKPC